MSRRVSVNQFVRTNVTSHDSSGSDEATCAESDAANDRRVRTQLASGEGPHRHAAVVPVIETDRHDHAAADRKPLSEPFSVVLSCDLNPVPALKRRAEGEFGVALDERAIAVVIEDRERREVELSDQRTARPRLHGDARADHAVVAAEEADAGLNDFLHVVERHLELNPDDPRALYLGAGGLMELGDRERAIAWTGRALALDPSDSGTLYNCACVYALGGQRDDAIKCLDQAVANGFGHREWLENDSDFDGIRDDPRFQAIVRKL